MKITLELHDAHKELPEKSGYYLVGCGRRERCYIANVPFSAKHKLFNAFDYDGKATAEKTAITNIDWWAEIPEEIYGFGAEGDGE